MGPGPCGPDPICDHYSVVVLQRVEDLRRGGGDAGVGTGDQRGSAGTQGAAAPDEGAVGLTEAHEVVVVVGRPVPVGDVRLITPLCDVMGFRCRSFRCQLFIRFASARDLCYESRSAGAAGSATTHGRTRHARMAQIVTWTTVESITGR